MKLSIFITLTFTAIFSILDIYTTYGQSVTTTQKETERTGRTDIVDVLQGGFKTHLRKDSASIKGNGPFISIMPIIGYTMQSGLTGGIVTNTSFYTGDNRSRFSNLLINGYTSQYHQYWFTANNSIFFEKQKIHLLGDMRYYNFPTQTFGIGTNSSLTDQLDIKYSYLRISQIVYLELAPSIFAGAGINIDYHWNITADTVQGKALIDLNTYQKGTRSISSGISLNLLYDNRRNSVNPDQGTYANIQFRPNMTFLGSDSNWQALIIDLRHYIKFPATSDNVIAFWYYNNFTLSGSPPYLDKPSVGWDSFSNTGRGYVPGRYTGNNFIYTESEYRFRITKNGMLGGVVFGNAETVYQNWSEKHTIIPGGGIGIRIKMNKYSKTNLAIDYGFGVNGSHGFFFNLGEVF